MQVKFKNVNTGETEHVNRSMRRIKKMKLIEKIALPNGLQLNIFDLSREIAADTVKVEISFQAEINLEKSFFADEESYRQVADIFGNTLTYEYKMERTFVSKERRNAVRTELVQTFKNNSLNYLGAENFSQKMAQAMLRDIRKNPYKYRTKADKET